MSKHFNVEKETIGDVFIAPKHRFQIPRFQRQYSWEERNIEEFWETILNSEPVFLGTIIFNNRRKDAEGIVEIIDGQQRYLTIQILGAVIRDYCFHLHDEYKDDMLLKMAKGTTRKLLGSEDDYEDAINPDSFNHYLIPGDGIKQFFDEYIQDFKSAKKIDEGLVTKRGSEKERIKKAYLKFRELLVVEAEKRGLEERKRFLHELVVTMLGRHFFALIEIEDEYLAYEIFETVNAKGVDLNVADLIKNQIFRHVVGPDGKYEDSAKERWQELTEKVDSCNIPIKDFLSYYWSSKYGYVPDRRLYRTIQEHFKESKRWDEFLTDLNDNSDFLYKIINGDVDDLETHFGGFKEAQRVFESLRVLRNTKAKTWVILYLCLFRNLNASEGKTPNIPLTLDKRWDIFARFTFLYYQVLNLPGNWYFQLVWKFSNRIEEYVSKKKSKNDFVELFSKELFSEFDSKLPKTLDDSFKDGFNGIRYNKNDQNSRIIIRYILSEFEAELGGIADTGFDADKVSIEHILPQTPTQWKVTAAESKAFVNTIGNLLLISKRANGSIGNKPFPEKLEDLRNSTHLNLVAEFISNVDNNIWRFGDISESKDFTSILLRGESLSERAYKIWVLDLKKKMGFGA